MYQNERLMRTAKGSRALGICLSVGIPTILLIGMRITTSHFKFVCLSCVPLSLTIPPPHSATAAAAIPHWCEVSSIRGTSVRYYFSADLALGPFQDVSLRNCTFASAGDTFSGSPWRYCWLARGAVATSLSTAGRNPSRTTALLLVAIFAGAIVSMVFVSTGLLVRRVKNTSFVAPGSGLWLFRGRDDAVCRGESPRVKLFEGRLPGVCRLSTLLTVGFDLLGPSPTCFLSF